MCLIVHYVISLSRIVIIIYSYIHRRIHLCIRLWLYCLTIVRKIKIIIIYRYVFIDNVKRQYKKNISYKKITR